MLFSLHSQADQPTSIKCSNDFPVFEGGLRKIKASSARRSMPSLSLPFQLPLIPDTLDPSLLYMGLEKGSASYLQFLCKNAETFLAGPPATGPGIAKAVARVSLG